MVCKQSPSSCIRAGVTRILWIWRHANQPWVRREACGYAAYGFCIHRWHTAVPHYCVEEWSYAAILQNGDTNVLWKGTMFGRLPDIACRWQITTPAVSLDLNVGLGLQWSAVPYIMTRRRALDFTTDRKGGQMRSSSNVGETWAYHTCYRLTSSVVNSYIIPKPNNQPFDTQESPVSWSRISPLLAADGGLHFRSSQKSPHSQTHWTRYFDRLNPCFTGT